jgi:hypothetical protein
VPTCPSCRAPLLANQDALFCERCRATLQTAENLALTLGLGSEDLGGQVQIVRPELTIGPCPGCSQGELAKCRLAGEPVAKCSGCGSMWIGGHALARIRANLERQARRTEPSSHGAAAPTHYENAFEYDTPLVNGVAVPAALLLGVLAQATGFDIFVYATTGMWMHELGHAIVAWLSGFFAIALPFVTLQASDDRSFLVTVVVLGAIGALAFYGYRKLRWGLVGFSGVLLVTQAVLTLCVNPAQATKWVIFSGLGGELVLPTALVLAFYQRLPARWDFWRYPVLAASGVTLVRGLFLWIGVRRGTRVMPHGSMLGADASGDVERLGHVYHWSEHDLAGTYIAIACLCVAVVACAYTFYFLRALKHASLRKVHSPVTAPFDSTPRT